MILVCRLFTKLVMVRQNYEYEILIFKFQVTFSLVHLEIQKTSKFNNHGGDRGPLLTSFCEYQGSQNPGDDSNPDHWDIGLLVSGVDFWAMSGSKKSYLTMGLATVTGICTKRYQNQPINLT